MTRKSKERKIVQPKKNHQKIEEESSRRELFAAMKLFEEGYRVSVPIGSPRYDLIAEKHPIYIRIQVKNLKLQFKGISDNTNTNDQWIIEAYTAPKGVRKTYSEKDIDVIFAVNLETQDFAIIPIKDIPKSGRVRISERAKRGCFLNSFVALEDIYDGQ